MRCYLVQHGQAKSKDEDTERPLTARGEEEVGRIASVAVEAFGVRTARIFHSGKTRARQTAEIWGNLLGARVEQASDLAPNDDPAAWADRLRTEVDDLMLVGHLPHLARLAASMFAGNADHSVIAFRQGGLVGLERTENGWAVAIVLPPDTNGN